MSRPVSVHRFTARRQRLQEVNSRLPKTLEDNRHIPDYIRGPDGPLYNLQEELEEMRAVMRRHVLGIVENSDDLQVIQLHIDLIKRYYWHLDDKMKILKRLVDALSVYLPSDKHDTWEEVDDLIHEYYHCHDSSQFHSSFFNNNNPRANVVPHREDYPFLHALWLELDRLDLLLAMISMKVESVATQFTGEFWVSSARIRAQMLECP
ncbi:hypothetical protein LTR70_003229 [Exophiala xenobiotica]|uniref:Uncharacterized protein n=1 Tax=Lithohypha guttulata TaxID=1690604 RepID=A0ABR0KGN1_9EURO|nr:hypothetical protein LTR24_002874 [Lithohypha guttulata]KAK5323741.1 hypothetical protein LTR70_003229 [Exophiala xenobiotica]